jgi:hypothetical protein
LKLFSPRNCGPFLRACQRTALIADLLEEIPGLSAQDFEEVLQILTRRGTSG